MGQRTLARASVLIFLAAAALAENPSPRKLYPATPKAGKAGYIDMSGSMVISPRFDYAGPFSEGYAFAVERGKCVLLDARGKSRSVKLGVNRELGCDAGHFSEGLAPAKGPGGWGFVDPKGRFVIPGQYEQVESFSEGLAAASRDGKWGYLDRTGKEMIPLSFEYARPFSEGLASVVLKGDAGYIGRDGKPAIKPRFARAERFSQGLAAVRGGGLWGYLDRGGKLAIDPKFESAFPFSEGLALVLSKGKLGFIDKTGKWAIPAQFDVETRGFSEGLAAVKKDGSWGFIDRRGSSVIQRQYLFAGDFLGGLALVTLPGERFAYIDRNGKTVWKSEEGAAVEEPAGGKAPGGDEPTEGKD